MSAPSFARGSFVGPGGAFEVLGALGRGGQGQVFRVKHREWGMDLALKVPLRVVNAAQRAGIVREAETWARLPLHPHVATCYFATIEGGVPWIYAELVEGGSLSSWIEQRRLLGGPAPLARLLDVAIETALGLELAHAEGLIHQDVKPHNVLMTADGVAKVTDFGLARGGSTVSAPAEAPSAREFGAPPSGEVPSALTLAAEHQGGTPAYASPEQYRAERDPGVLLTRRTDLWSWALLVLETFEGRVARRMGRDAPRALAEHQKAAGHPEMPAQLRALLARCFEIDESRRPRSMLECVEHIRGFYQEVTGRAPPPARKAYYDGADELYNRGASLVALGSSQTATECFQRALALDPQHFGATYARALLSWRAGELTDEEAQRTVEEAREFVRLRARAPGASRLPKAEADELVAWLFAERGADAAAERAMIEAAATRGDKPPSRDRFERELRGAIRVGRSVQVFASSAEYAVAADGQRIVTTGLDADGKPGIAWFSFETEKVQGRGALPLLPEGVAWARGSDTAIVWAESRLFTVRAGAPAEEVTIGPAGLVQTRASLGGPADLRIFGAGAHVVAGTAADEMLAERQLSTGALRLDARNVRTGRGLWNRTVHTRSVAIAISMDGKVAATIAADGTVRRWDVATGRCVSTVPVSVPGPPRGLFLSGNGRALFVVDQRGRMHRYELETALARAILPARRPTRSEELASRQDALELALSRIEPLIDRDAREAGRQLHELTREPWVARLPPVRAIWERLADVLPRGAITAAWPSLELRAAPTGAVSVEVDPMGKRVFAAGFGATGAILRWDTPSGSPSPQLSHGAPVSSLSISRDGARLCSAGSGRVRVWHVASGALQGEITAAEVRHAAVSDRGWAALAVAQRIELHDVTRGAKLAVVDLGSDVRRVALAPDGLRAVAATARGVFEVTFDLGGMALDRRQLVGPSEALDVALSAGRVLSGSADGALRLFDGAGELTERGTSEAPLTGVTLADDARLAIAVDARGRAAIWTFPDAFRIATLSGHAVEASDVALTPSGRVAVTGGADGRVRVWTLEWTLVAGD